MVAHLDCAGGVFPACAITVPEEQLVHLLLEASRVQVCHGCVVVVHSPCISVIQKLQAVWVYCANASSIGSNAACNISTHRVHPVLHLRCMGHIAYLQFVLVCGSNVCAWINCLVLDGDIVPGCIRHVTSTVVLTVYALLLGFCHVSIWPWFGWGWCVSLDTPCIQELFGNVGSRLPRWRKLYKVEFWAQVRVSVHAVGMLLLLSHAVVACPDPNGLCRYIAAMLMVQPGAPVADQQTVLLVWAVAYFT
jgi:hypothetical protein